jgi:RHH-type proline utilization regulon transcriptional repressor/proline dehydrogenase/delta 1-pyrroline-5-carboxylate dehydrogenase
MNYQHPSGSDQPLRVAIRDLYLADEQTVVDRLLDAVVQTPEQESEINRIATGLVKDLRSEERQTSLIDSFLQQFTLSSEEGIVLMCLAEALLRIPDADTADALIRDKLSSGDWGAHLGQSESLLVNASTWGMLLTGKWVTMDDGTRRDPYAFLKRLVSKSGEPAIRLAVRQAMKIMGQEFVLAETIDAALKKAGKQQAKGFTYSYDMLGEGAKTEKDAKAYMLAYQRAISALAAAAKATDPVSNPGISVKLSALHPRYEFAHIERVETELYARLLQLAIQAKDAQLGFNIDAEEADRLEPSLSLFEKLAFEPALEGWDGLGFVVQAYQKRAPAVIDWMAGLAQKTGHRFMLRLVKGAYWDTEIKHAQVEGQVDYPVFTRKENTDLSYLVCAHKLLASPRAFYPQFASHNARTVAEIMAYVDDLPGVDKSDFEFQCLHGMGEALYETVVSELGYRCRIYAPVGEHKRLLAYLVRRLLENGANTSFVNLLANKDQDMTDIIANPVSKVRKHQTHRHGGIPLPVDLYAAKRKNSSGANLADSNWLDEYYAYLASVRDSNWVAAPLLGSHTKNTRELQSISNPADERQQVGSVQLSSDEQVDAALEAARDAFYEWDALGGDIRAGMLDKAADLYEEHRFELMALCQLEAGKTLADAVSEVREAIDFLRYYALRARQEFSGPLLMEGPTGETNEYTLNGRGVFVCISPWNFPLAIFTGQLAAALVAGNAVLVKPAEQTPLIAWRAVQLLHEAGVLRAILQYLPGEGHTVGAMLSSDPRVDGVVFTGGTDTARLIHTALGNRPNSPLPHLIAETGGLNAMIVDSSALAEQVVDDVIASAFQSAGQRCSALRVLYVQEDIADDLLEMIKGAMLELKTGDQTCLDTDVGPIIDAQAREALEVHTAKFADAQVLARAPEASGEGNYFEPVLLEIDGIQVLDKEIFGPVLHLAKFKSRDLDKVIDAINASGYGLTLGVHSRINSTIERVRARARVGNLYVNRNIIGAVVGAQPFGGEGLSGTGPKAGGPHYLHRFAVERVVSTDTTAAGGNASLLTLG